ncbi:MAG TPA: hypothetical protein VIG64_07015, partial [Actinomycetota bacterium]
MALASDDGTELLSDARAFLTDPEARLEWRSLYPRLHAAATVDLGDQHWLVAGHDDARRVFRDPGSAVRAPFPVTSSPLLNELFLGLLPYEHGPSHARLRGLTQGFFSTPALGRIEPHLTTALSDDLFPAVFESHGCDVSTTLGVNIPQVASCLLLDV